jgi:hypothetical protein
MLMQRTNHDPIAKRTKVLSEKESHMATMRATCGNAHEYAGEYACEHTHEPINTAKAPFFYYLTDFRCSRHLKMLAYLMVSTNYPPPFLNQATHLLFLVIDIPNFVSMLMGSIRRFKITFGGC